MQSVVQARIFASCTFHTVSAVNVVHVYWKLIRRFNTCTKITPTISKPSRHLLLRTVSPTLSHAERGKPKSMVLLFPWLNASTRAVDKYCQIYHDRGLDVLSINCELKHFLMPATASHVANELLNYLTKNETPLNTDAFIIHSFSVGAYVYTVTLMTILKEKEKYGAVMNKIKGQILDSIVYGGLNRMISGVAITQTQNPSLQQAIKALAKTYFFFSYPLTVLFYDKSVDFITKAPIRAPTLVYYCLNDVICDGQALDELLRTWISEYDMLVHVKCWEKSVHAHHLREHPEQYSKTLQGFLANLGYIES